MEQSLADRGDGEKLIETKVGGVHLTDSQPSVPLVCVMGLRVLIMQ